MCRCYWARSRWRFFVVMGVNILVVGSERWQGFAFADVFRGVIQESGTFYTPFLWLFLMLSPFIIAGTSMRQLVCGDYLRVHQVPLRTYGLTALALVLSSVWAPWLVWVAVSRSVQWVFAIEMGVTLSLLMAIYAISQCLVWPYWSLLGVLALLTATVGWNQMPLLSQLMSLRFGAEHTWQVGVVYAVMSVIVGGLFRMLYRIDFVTEKG